MSNTDKIYNISQIYYGNVICLNETLEIVNQRNMLFSSSSFLFEDSLSDDIFYESPEYRIVRDLEEAKRNCKIFTNERIYVINAKNLYSLLSFFGFPREFDEKTCIALKRNLFNGRFAYDHCELFGYTRKTKAYWQNGIFLANWEELENNKYNITSYERFAINDLTPYFSILNQVPRENPDSTFEPIVEEGPIRKRILNERGKIIYE